MRRDIRFFYMPVVPALCAALFGCSSSDDSNKGPDVSVDNACDIMVNQCGGASQGFTLTECRSNLGGQPFDCMKCVIDVRCNYETACHDPTHGCDLK